MVSSRFMANQVCHIFKATISRATAFPHLIQKLMELLQYIYDPQCLPEFHVCVTDKPPELMQELRIKKFEILLKIPRKAYIHR